MANEEMKNNVNEEVKVEETKTDEVEELKKLLAEAKGLLEAQNNKPQEEKKEEPKGFFGKIGDYFKTTSVRDFACDAGKWIGGALLIGGAAFGAKKVYDNRHGVAQLPGETYVDSQVVNNDTLE